MKLLTNSKCQLILDGLKPEKGLEVIVYNDKYTVVERESNSTEFFFDMPEDGLFQYLFDIDFKQTDEFICDFTKPYTDGELKMIEDYCKNAIHNKDKFTKKGGEYGKIADYIANLMMNNETYSKLGVTKQYCFVYDAMSIAEIVDHEGLSNKDKYDKVKFWLEQYEKDKNK